MPAALQDITYTYDPVGNVTHVENPLSDVVDNADQKISPDFDYTYDALYRLKESQGREHPGIGQQGQEHQNNIGAFWDKTPVSDPSKITPYTESYSYDPGNNLNIINHQGTQNWKRTNTIAENSNRLSQSGLGGGHPTDINYDANGNQTDMAGKPLLWNYRDNIASAGMIPRTADGPNVEYYVYDASGSRVRKVNVNQTGDANSITSEVVYLGNFEIRRSGTSTSESEWHSMRYSDGKGVFCELRYQTQGDVPPGETNHQTCYQLTNLINSIGMEVDETGELLSYEEYYPYGGTAFIAGKDKADVDERHYRYSGKEQDQSGLYYYGMRYYCTWTGRWVSADPAGTVDGLNLYAFVKGNPVTHVDVRGMGTEEDDIESLRYPEKQLESRVTEEIVRKGLLPQIEFPTNLPSSLHSMMSSNDCGQVARLLQMHIQMRHRALFLEKHSKTKRITKEEQADYERRFSREVVGTRVEIKYENHPSFPFHEVTVVGEGKGRLNALEGDKSVKLTHPMERSYESIAAISAVRGTHNKIKETVIHKLKDNVDISRVRTNIYRINKEKEAQMDDDQLRYVLYQERQGHDQSEMQSKHQRAQAESAALRERSDNPRL